MKKDFPGLFDITAAGHILSTETVADGIREVEEELGIEVDLTKLHSKGVVQEVSNCPNLLTVSFRISFCMIQLSPQVNFTLQQEEVESVHVVERKALIDLF